MSDATPTPFGSVLPFPAARIAEAAEAARIAEKISHAHALAGAYSHGREAGIHMGYQQGWWYGLLCGLVAGVLLLFGAAQLGMMMAGSAP